MGTTETSFSNKNFEDFLLMKTQPTEFPSETHDFLAENPLINPKNLHKRDFSCYFQKKNYKRDFTKNFNEKGDFYEEILDKMKVFKGQKGLEMEKSINYMMKQFEKNHINYYEFLQEKDPLTLRFLIQILYDKLQVFSNNNDKIEVLEQKLVDSQRNSSVLQDEMMEKNIEFNTVNTKFCILLQKSKDFLWLIAETRKEMKNMLFSEKNAMNFTRKTALENLLKEFENLEGKMKEFEPFYEEKNENLGFLKKFEKSRKNIVESFRAVYEEKKPLKENFTVLNTRNEEKKTLEIFEKELK